MTCSVGRFSLAGNTALLEAAVHAKGLECEKVRELIDAGSDVHINNNGGYTGLHIAAMKGNMVLLQVKTNII